MKLELFGAPTHVAARPDLLGCGVYKGVRAPRASDGIAHLLWERPKALAYYFTVQHALERAGGRIPKKSKLVHKDDPAEHFLFTAPDGEVVPAQKLADELSEPSGVFRLVGASVDRLCACVLWIMSHRLANDWFNDSFKELDPEARAYYYRVIHEPMTLLAALNEKDNELESAFLVFLNATLFNDPGSAIHDFAKELEKRLCQACDSLEVDWMPIYERARLRARLRSAADVAAAAGGDVWDCATNDDTDDDYIHDDNEDDLTTTIDSNHDEVITTTLAATMIEGADFVDPWKRPRPEVRATEPDAEADADWEQKMDVAKSADRFARGRLQERSAAFAKARAYEEALSSISVAGNDAYLAAVHHLQRKYSLEAVYALEALVDEARTCASVSGRRIIALERLRISSAEAALRRIQAKRVRREVEVKNEIDALRLLTSSELDALANEERANQANLDALIRAPCGPDTALATLAHAAARQTPCSP